MPNLPPLDTTGMGDLCEVLAQLPAAQLAAALQAIEKHVREGGGSVPRITPVLAYIQAGTRGTGRQEWLQLIRSGLAFAKGGLVLNVAAQFSYVQLFNPANSGLRVLLYAAFAATSGAVAASNFGYDNTDAAGVLVGKNLLSGGPNSVCHLTEFTSAAAFPTVPLARKYTGAGSGNELGITQGFICELPPNTGFDIQIGTVNEDMAYTLQWAEVPADYP